MASNISPHFSGLIFVGTILNIISPYQSRKRLSTSPNRKLCWIVTVWDGTHLIITVERMKVWKTFHFNLLRLSSACWCSSVTVLVHWTVDNGQLIADIVVAKTSPRLATSWRSSENATFPLQSGTWYIRILHCLIKAEIHFQNISASYHIKIVWSFSFDHINLPLLTLSKTKRRFQSWSNNIGLHKIRPNG